MTPSRASRRSPSKARLPRKISVPADSTSSFERFFGIFRPPEKLTGSQWADRHYVLSPENSSTPGPWKTFGWQREVLDALVDPDIREVTCRKSARVGWTKLLNIATGYDIHQDPRSALIVQPTVEDAEEYSKDEIAPMIRDVDVVGAKAMDDGPRKASRISSTITKKAFEGSTLYLRGANSGRGFRRFTVSRVRFDEVDAYPTSAGDEGSPIRLGKARAADAEDATYAYGSSPKLKRTSLIDSLFDLSDQRLYFVPCPLCDHFQTLRWGGPEEDYGIKWDDDPADAYYLCEKCHDRIEYRHQRTMVERGQWEAQRPEVVDHAGFHIWAAYSYLPQAAWGVIAQEFLECKGDPAQLQVFVNTVLGESYEQRGRAPNEQKLATRVEPYPVRTIESEAPGEAAREVLMVPKGAAILTAGVDVQLDRVEVGVEGWGFGQENWKLEYRVLYGDPTAAGVWAALWEYLVQPRHLERGDGETVDYIRSTCIDTGYAAQAVSEFVRPRSIFHTADQQPAYLWAVKGDDGPGPVFPQAPSIGKYKTPFYTVKVNTAKDAIASRWDLEEPGPGYIHVPRSPEFGPKWFHQVTAEHALDNGRWELKAGHKRNEALDVSVYNYAALCALIVLGLDLDDLALWLRGEAPRPIAATPSAPTPAAASSSSRREGWMANRGRGASRSGRDRWISR